MAHLDERIITEGTTAFLTMQFVDLTGKPTPPLSASYRIDDLGTGLVIRSSTPLQVSPEGLVTVLLDKDDNVIVNPGNFREERRVSVVGQFNGGLDESTLVLADVAQAYDYHVDRLIQGPSFPLLMKALDNIKTQLIKYFSWTQ